MTYPCPLHYNRGMEHKKKITIGGVVDIEHLDAKSVHPDTLWEIYESEFKREQGWDRDIGTLKIGVSDNDHMYGRYAHHMLVIENDKKAKVNNITRNGTVSLELHPIGKKVNPHAINHKITEADRLRPETFKDLQDAEFAPIIITELHKNGIKVPAVNRALREFAAAYDLGKNLTLKEVKVLGHTLNAMGAVRTKLDKIKTSRIKLDGASKAHQRVTTELFDDLGL